MLYYKNLFLAKEGGYLSIDYNALAAGVQERMNYAEYIDIIPLLSADDYYYTDSHWKQENIVDVAEHLATSMGAQFSNDFAVNTLDNPFKGTYYGQAALPLIKPDTIKYLTNSAIENCTVKGVDESTGKYISILSAYSTGNCLPIERQKSIISFIYGQTATKPCFR